MQRSTKSLFLGSAIGAGLTGALLWSSAAYSQTPVSDPGPTNKAAVEEVRRDAEGGTNPPATNTPTAYADTEIIVTAQRRAENLRDVPIAVTAIDGERLATRGIKDLVDMTAEVPSLRIVYPGNAAVVSLTLRGVGQRDINIQQEGAVALFVDGSYVSFIPSVGQPIWDVERVEVLKGPQGTLFGRNATGGLIQFISKRPTDKLDGYFTAQYGSFNEVRLEGAIGGPLAQGVSARASVLYNRADGYVKNVSGPDLNALDTFAARLQLLLEPTENFSFLINARTWQAFDGPGAGIIQTPLMIDNGVVRRPRNYPEYASFCTGITAGTVATPVGAEIIGDCFTANPDMYTVNTSAGVRWNEKYYDISGTAEWQLNDAVTMTSISDYQHMTMDYVADVDAAPPPYFFYGIHGNGSEQFSQEIRFNGTSGNFDWIGGLYYLRINHDLSNNTDLFGHPAFGIQLLADYTQKTRSSAAFANVDWNLTPQLTFSVGGRVMHDKKTIKNVSTCIPNPALVPVQLCDILGAFVYPNALAFNRSFVGKISDDSWSGQVKLRYKPDELTMFYAGVSRGTKGGGFNSGGAEFYTADEVEFGPEVLTSYEVGAKVLLFDRVLSLDGSVFYYDYKGFQTYSSGDRGGLRVFNIDAEVKGAELAVLLRPVEGLTLLATGSYLDTKQKDVPVGNGVFQDFQMPEAPKWGFNGELRYAFKIMADHELALQANALWVDSRSTAAIDNPELRYKSYERIDLRATLTSADEHWSLAAFVNNVTDEPSLSSRIDFAAIHGAVTQAIDRPRWYGAQITYRF